MAAMREPDNKSPSGSRPSASSRSSVDLDDRELARIAERNRLIVKVMEINEKQRHYESRHLGLKLQLEHARRDAGGPDETEEQREHIASLATKFRELSHQLEKFAAERHWIENMLAEIDGAVAPPALSPHQGRA